MAVHLQKEINKLKKNILHLGTMVEELVRKGVDSLEKRDIKLAEEVLARDNDIDHMEVDLEEECLKILALYQPVANDLRFVIAILKINNDLERIGDLAGNIAERAIEISNADPLHIDFDFHRMGGKVQSMLRDSLDALVNSDHDLALKVCQADDEVDAMNREIYNIVQQGVRANVNCLELYIQYIAVSRALERIADHATNIAEDVMYMIQGEIVRHTEGLKHKAR